MLAVIRGRSALPFENTVPNVDEFRTHLEHSDGSAYNLRVVDNGETVDVIVESLGGDEVTSEAIWSFVR